MFFSEGQSCPVCKKAFQKEDDIVVCPICGAPHHRACYKEIDHCFYEDAHGTDEQWSREKAKSMHNTAKSNTASLTRRCPHCGFDNPSFAEFCGHCGRPVEPDFDDDFDDDFDNETAPKNAVPFDGNSREFTYIPFRVPTQNTGGVDPDTPIGGERAADVAKVVGINQEYYMPTFSKFETTGKSTKWNWAAFLLGPYWLLYRKCYLTGGLLFLFSLLQSATLSYIEVKKLQLQNISEADLYATLQAYSAPGHPMQKYVLIISLLFVISLALRIFFGLFGNAIYEHSCLKKIRSNKDTIGTDPAALTMASGVSLGLPIYAFFTSELIQLLLSNLLPKL